MLRGAFVPTAAVALVIVVAITLGAGARAGGGALLGAVVALAFFALGLVVMVKLRSADDPFRFFATSLAVVFGQLIFLLVVILVFSGAQWLDGRSFGLAALAVALVWQALQVVAYVRNRRLVFDAGPVEASTESTESTDADGGVE